MTTPIEKHNTPVISSTKWPIYCFVDHRGDNVIREWLRAERVQKAQIAIFQAKIDGYERGGPDLSPGLIFGPISKSKHIFKMKIKGNKGHVQLRPLLCYGPVVLTEVSLLKGAIEKDSVLVPEKCIDRALENRETLIANPKRRRRERVD